jgi:hypothetical protein
VSERGREGGTKEERKRERGKEGEGGVGDGRERERDKEKMRQREREIERATWPMASRITSMFLRGATPAGVSLSLTHTSTAHAHTHWSALPYKHNSLRIERNYSARTQARALTAVVELEALLDLLLHLLAEDGARRLREAVDARADAALVRQVPV